jgi:hypothetical protein
MLSIGGVLLLFVDERVSAENFGHVGGVAVAPGGVQGAQLAFSEGEPLAARVFVFAAVADFEVGSLADRDFFHQVVEDFVGLGAQISSPRSV